MKNAIVDPQISKNTLTPLSSKITEYNAHMITRIVHTVKQAVKKSFFDLKSSLYGISKGKRDMYHMKY